MIYSKPFILYIYVCLWYRFHFKRWSILIRLCSVYMLHGSCFRFKRWSAQIIQYMYAYDSCFQEMIYSEPFIHYIYAHRSFNFFKRCSILHLSSSIVGVVFIFKKFCVKYLSTTADHHFRALFCAYQYLLIHIWIVILFSHIPD